MDLTELETIADRELRKHGLGDWSFGFANTKRRLGVCKYRSKRIEIAEYYARNNPPEKVLDTLFHEIAHALVGPGGKHGPAWKAMAVRLGATPLACDHSRDTDVTPGDWQSTCPTCRRTYQRYKRPSNLAGYRCRCAARSPLVFEYVGDPAFKPFVPMSREESANWEARCDGCGVMHYRLRRPSPGEWRCKCRHRCRIAWRFRTKRSTPNSRRP